MNSMAPPPHSLGVRQSSRISRRSTRSSSLAGQDAFKKLTLSQVVERCDESQNKFRRRAKRKRKRKAKEANQNDEPSSGIAHASEESSGHSPVSNNLGKPGPSTVSDSSREQGLSLESIMPIDEKKQRILRADPFVQTVKYLSEKEICVDNGGKRSNYTFRLDVNASFYSMMKAEPDKYQLHFGSLLVEDHDCSDRLNLPVRVSVKINGESLEAMYKTSAAQYTKSGRDPPVNLQEHIVQGENTLIFGCEDTRSFYFYVREVSIISIDEMKSDIIKRDPVDYCNIVKSEKKAEDDLTITPTIGLRCPYSCQIMKHPVRSKKCTSYCGVFDLQSFLQLAKQTRKWTCPSCRVQLLPSDIAVDSFVSSVIQTRDEKELQAGHYVEVDVVTGNWRYTD